MRGKFSNSPGGPGNRASSGSYTELSELDRLPLRKSFMMNRTAGNDTAAGSHTTRSKSTPSVEGRRTTVDAVVH